MLFSVVIPTHNRRALLEHSLASVWAQTFTDYEVVVVDDGSDDGTREYLADLGDRLRWISQSNAGPSAARNAGATLACGEYLAFLDSDDLWFPWALQKFSEAIDHQRRPILIAGMVHEVQNGEALDTSIIDNATLEYEYLGDFFASSGEVSLIGIGTCVIRRDRYLAVGGLSEALRSLEDLDLFLRLGTDEGFLRILRPHTITYRRHGGGLTADYTETVAGAAFLITGEREGRYPGGLARAHQRREIITRTVRSVSIDAIREVSVPAAIRLYRSALDWHIAALRISYLGGFWLRVIARTFAEPRMLRDCDDV